MIGKTRMPELAIWGFTHSALGTTRNPLDPARTPAAPAAARGGGGGRDGGAGAGHRRRAARSASRRRTAGWSGSSRAAASCRCRAARPSTGTGCPRWARSPAPPSDAALMLGVLAGRDPAARCRPSRGPPSRAGAPWSCRWPCRCAARHRSRAARHHRAARSAPPPGCAPRRRGRGHARRPALPAHAGARTGRRALAGRRGRRRARLALDLVRRRAPHGRGGAARAAGAAVRRAPRGGAGGAGATGCWSGSTRAATTCWSAPPPRARRSPRARSRAAATSRRCALGVADALHAGVEPGGAAGRGGAGADGGRPVGVQLVGRPGAEIALLAVAARLEGREVPLTP